MARGKGLFLVVFDEGGIAVAVDTVIAVNGFFLT
jgi:hypothetical protein